MKKLVIKIFIAIFTIFSLINFICALELILKLPYPKGERFIVTQGYKTLPTHKPGSLDEYALDFDQGGCKAYGKPVLAVASGIVIAINDINKNRSDYGNYVDIEHTPGLKSRYAHLEKFIVTLNQEVKQGEIIGYVGNTGKVFGEACPEHPGTHLHFAMYQRQPDGKLIAYKPEPMSGYTNFVAGNWYTSDNEIYQIKFAEENKSSESSSSNNFWQNLKSLFSGLWQNFINSINNLLGLNQQEEQNEAVFSQTPTTYQEEFYDAKLIEKNPNQKLIIKENQEVLLTVKFKNTGTITWRKENVSLNVANEEAKKFYHPSWLTRKRPTSLKELKVEPNEIGSFEFLITASNLEPKNYYLSFKPVYQDSTGFHWLSSEIVFWQVAVEKEEKEIALEENSYQNNFSQEEANEKINNEENLIENKNQKETPIYSLGTGGGIPVLPFSDTTPPEIRLISYPQNPTSSPIAVFEFSANEEVVYKCKLDENEKEECVSPKIYENLSDGEHYFFLEAFDSASNQSSLVYVWQIDSTPPNSSIITSGFYNSSTWPNLIEGNVDSNADLLKVEIQIKREKDGKYLSYSSSDYQWVDEPFWLETNLSENKTSWSFPLPSSFLSDGYYSIYSKATDLLGNTQPEFSSSQFVFDNTIPWGSPKISIEKENDKIIVSWTEVEDELSGISHYQINWRTIPIDAWRESGWDEEWLEYCQEKGIPCNIEVKIHIYVWDGSNLMEEMVCSEEELFQCEEEIYSRWSVENYLIEEKIEFYNWEEQENWYKERLERWWNEGNFENVSGLRIEIPFEDDKRYYFRVRGVDKAGNKGDWSEEKEYPEIIPVPC